MKNPTSKIPSADLKKVNSALQDQLEKMSLLISEYSVKHSPVEVVAFNQGISAGIKIITESI